MDARVWVSQTHCCRRWLNFDRPVYSLLLGTKTTIVLSSDEAVKDLLDRRSGNYSDRPNVYIGQTIASSGLRLVVMVGHHPNHALSRCALLAMDDLALWSILANHPQDNSQHPQYRGCCNLRTVSGSGEQDNAKGPSR
jgi:hypothetical protein